MYREKGKRNMEKGNEGNSEKRGGDGQMGEKEV